MTRIIIITVKLPGFRYADMNVILSVILTTESSSPAGKKYALIHSHSLSLSSSLSLSHTVYTGSWTGEMGCTTFFFPHQKNLIFTNLAVNVRTS